MDNTNPEEDVRQSLTCGARSLACFNYVDPTTYERVGAKLLLQACLCPAAVLAANVSLLDGDEAASHSHRIPCADGFAIGPRGLEEYRRMCRSQLTCGILCMGLPVLYTENLIQRQRIRMKYGLRDPTSLSEIGAGCCYPCSIFQSHTFLYVLTHHSSRQSQRTGANGPLLSALRAMQRGAATNSRSQDVIVAQQEGRAAIGVPFAPKAPQPEQQLYASKPETCSSPANRQKAARAEEVTPTAMRRASTSFTDMAAHVVVSASGIVSSVGETPDQVVTLFGRGRRNSWRPPQPAPAASVSSAESRSTPASSSIPPPEVTDSPRVGAPPPAYNEAESALADSTSFPVPSALPIHTVVRSPPKFEVPPALKPPDSADSEVISAWMQGPKLSHLTQSLQKPAVSAQQPAKQASSVAQPSQAAAACPTTSGMSVSDASLFSLKLDPVASQAPAPHSSLGAAPAPSAGTSAPAAGAAPLPPAPSDLPPPPTPGSSRDLQAAPANYDTITSSKLSSMIDHAMLNGSGSAGRGSAAAGGGTALSSVDPAGPWDSYRHSAMAPIPEAEAEEGPWSSANLTESRGVQDRVPGAGGASEQRLAPANSLNSERSLHANGSGSSLGSTLCAAQVQGTPGDGSQRGSGAAAVAGGPICTGSAALLSLARMGYDTGSSTIPAPGSGRAGGVYSRIPSAAAVPPPSRRASPPAAAASAIATAAPGRTVAAANVKESDMQTVSVGGGTDEEDMDEGLGASADNFSLNAVAPKQVLLRGGAPLQLRQQGPQKRYGAPPARTVPFPGPPLAPAPAFRVCADDDEVNLASVRPSFIDGPEMEHRKEVLRAAGEKCDAVELQAPAVSAGAAPAIPVTSNNAVSSSATLISQRVVSLPPSLATLPQRRGSSSRRYGDAQAAPAFTAAGAGTACFGVSAAAAAPYASFCEDAHSQDDVAGGGCGGSMEDDASSAIDGPVSSGEETDSLLPGRTAAATEVATRRSSIRSISGGEAPASASDTAADDSTAVRVGDASVSVAVAAAPPPKGAEEHDDESSSAPAVDPAESVASGAARRSASGLSNGEPNTGYESVADSVCASQHRQKHWVNWMAQSVGMSMAANSVAVGDSSRAVRPAAYGKPGGRPPLEPGSGHFSISQRVPQPVLEESTDGLFKPWE